MTSKMLCKAVCPLTFLRILLFGIPLEDSAGRFHRLIVWKLTLGIARSRPWPGRRLNSDGRSWQLMWVFPLSLGYPIIYPKFRILVEKPMVFGYPYFKTYPCNNRSIMPRTQDFWIVCTTHGLDILGTVDQYGCSLLLGIFEAVVSIVTRLSRRLPCSLSRSATSIAYPVNSVLRRCCVLRRCRRRPRHPKWSSWVRKTSWT